MKKNFFILFFCFMGIVLIYPDSINDSKIPNYIPDIKKDILNKKDKYQYSFKEEKDTLTLYYGNEHNWDRVSGALGQRGYLIYYQTPGNEYYLKSIKILGIYKGDPKKKFQIILEDINNIPFYISDYYTFDEFSEDRIMLKEFQINIANLPDEFYINLINNESQKDNSLYIHGFKSEHIYSYNLLYLGIHSEFKGENWAIMPVFEKINKKVKNKIQTIKFHDSLNKFTFNKLFYDSITYLYKEKLFDDLSEKDKETIYNNLDKIIPRETTLEELINLLPDPVNIEIKNENTSFKINVMYGPINFKFDYNTQILENFIIYGINTPLIYANKIKTGTSINDVFLLLGNPIENINSGKIASKDKVLYKNIYSYNEMSWIFYEKKGVGFFFWDDIITDIYIYKSKNKYINEISIFNNPKKETTSFIYNYNELNSFCNRDLSVYFRKIFNTGLYGIYYNGLGSIGNINYLKENKDSFHFKYISNKFIIISYVKSLETQYNFIDIINLFYPITREEINRQIDVNKSMIIYNERENNKPLLILAAENEENMKKVYESLKNKKIITNGLYILNHKKDDVKL